MDQDQGLRTVAVVDDHTLVREGVSRLVEQHRGWRLCAQGANGQEAIEISREKRPDLIVMDFAMPEKDGISAAKAIISENPKARIILITGYDPESILKQAREVGVKGLILKTDAGRVLEQAIETVLDGGEYFSTTGLFSEYGRGTSRVGDGVSPVSMLSAREKEIVGLIGDGLTSKAIAEKLGISARTVETHRANIMRKLNMRSVVDVVRFALRHGLTNS